MSDFIQIEYQKLPFAQVPKKALKDKKLSLKAKGLYAYLFSLPVGWKIFKTEIVNNFSDGRDSVNAAFKELESAGYIVKEHLRESGKFGTLKFTLLWETVNGKPVNGETASTNTNSTNTDKSFLKRKEGKKTKVFIPPSLDEVKEFFKEKGFTEDSAVRAFGGYNVAEWEDSKGNKVKNWKQKMYHVWFKPENKIQLSNKSQPEITFKK